MSNTVKDLLALQDKINEGVAECHERAGSMSASEHRDKTETLKAMRASLSAKITEGALPCSCGAGKPHGMIQPLGKKGRVEFEVGCLACPRRVRGGLLPRHAVEAWNEEHGKAESEEA